MDIASASLLGLGALASFLLPGIISTHGTNHPDSRWAPKGLTKENVGAELDSVRAQLSKVQSDAMQDMKLLQYIRNAITRINGDLFRSGSDNPRLRIVINSVNRNWDAANEQLDIIERTVSRLDTLRSQINDTFRDMGDASSADPSKAESITTQALNQIRYLLAEATVLDEDVDEARGNISTAVYIVQDLVKKTDEFKSILSIGRDKLAPQLSALDSGGVPQLPSNIIRAAKERQEAVQVALEEYRSARNGVKAQFEVLEKAVNAIPGKNKSLEFNAEWSALKRDVESASGGGTDVNVPGLDTYAARVEELVNSNRVNDAQGLLRELNDAATKIRVNRITIDAANRRMHDFMQANTALVDAEGLMKTDPLSTFQSVIKAGFADASSINTGNPTAGGVDKLRASVQAAVKAYQVLYNGLDALNSTAAEDPSEDTEAGSDSKKIPDYLKAITEEMQAMMAWVHRIYNGFPQSAYPVNTKQVSRSDAFEQFKKGRPDNFWSDQDAFQESMTEEQFKAMARDRIDLLQIVGVIPKKKGKDGKDKDGDGSKGGDGARVFVEDSEEDMRVTPAWKAFVYEILERDQNGVPNHAFFSTALDSIVSSNGASNDTKTLQRAATSINNAAKRFIDNYGQLKRKLLLLSTEKHLRELGLDPDKFRLDLGVAPPPAGASAPPASASTPAPAATAAAAASDVASRKAPVPAPSAVAAPPPPAARTFPPVLTRVRTTPVTSVATATAALDSMEEALDEHESLEQRVARIQAQRASLQEAIDSVTDPTVKSNLTRLLTRLNVRLS